MESLSADALCAERRSTARTIRWMSVRLKTSSEVWPAPEENVATAFNRVVAHRLTKKLNLGDMLNRHVRWRQTKTRRKVALLQSMKKHEADRRPLHAIRCSLIVLAKMRPYVLHALLGVDLVACNLRLCEADESCEVTARTGFMRA